MMRSLVRTFVAFALPALLYACGGETLDPASPSDDGPSEARDIDIIEGYGQYGRTGMYFPEFLRVQVTDAQGEAVPGVTVDWSVVRGPLEVSHQTAQTNRFGVAKVTLRAQPELGDGVVRASVRGEPDLAVEFEETVSAVQVVMKSDQYSEMTFQSELVVEVGDTIEWLNKDMTDTHGMEAAMHTATSMSVPPGGTTFDSGKLRFNETFAWAPNTTGRWEYHCDDHPMGERMYGTIKVVAKKE